LRIEAEKKPKKGGWGGGGKKEEEGPHMRLLNHEVEKARENKGN
jgi:hypothetical protein